MTAAHWQHWWPLLGALAFAGILAALPNDRYRDRDHYTAYLENAPAYLLSWLDSDLISILTNEPLFLLINAALTTLLSAEQALQLLIFAPSAIVAYLVLRTSPEHAVFLVAILLVPQLLQKQVVHLRQGLAISVFLVGWLASSPRSRWSLIGLTPFIHTSFFFVLMLMAVTWAIRRLRSSPWVAVCAFAMVSVATALSLEELARAFGARQSEEYDFSSAQSISGAGILFWCAILGLFFTQSRRFLREHTLEIGAVVFYVSTYLLSPVTVRVFESMMLLVVLSALKMTGIGRLAFMASIVLFSLLHWLMMYVGLVSSFTVTGL